MPQGTVWIVARTEEDSGYDQILAVYDSEDAAWQSARAHLVDSIRSAAAIHNVVSDDISEDEVARAASFIIEEPWGLRVSSDYVVSHGGHYWLVDAEVSVYERRVRHTADDASGEGNT